MKERIIKKLNSKIEAKKDELADAYIALLLVDKNKKVKSANKSVKDIEKDIADLEEVILKVREQNI